MIISPYIHIFSSKVVETRFILPYKFNYFTKVFFPDGSDGKNTPAMRETWVRSLDWEDHLEKKMAPTPIFWPGKFYGQRRLAGYSPWGPKESDRTE